MKSRRLIAALILPLGYGLAYADVSIGTDLTGQVTLPDGNFGAATVLVSYAQLKTNYESSVSSRYPILPRRAQTDRQGNFKIESFDARWWYFGEVMAPGCRLKTLDQIDPVAGPLKIALETANTNVPPNQVIHGRVTDAAGRGIAGALIDITGTTRNGQGTWPGQEIDYYSVSDDVGNFVVHGQTPFAAVDGKVEAAGYAEATFEQWPSDAINQEWARTRAMPEGLFGYAKPLHQITLIHGAALQGRLVQAGRPVADAEIRLNQCAAGSNCWFWDAATVTDDQGRFLFAHLPPDQNWSICGNWDLPATAGVVPPTNVKIGADGSTNDLGDLNLQSVSQVAGRIRLSDGKPIPANSTYSLSDAAMGRSSPSVLGADGSFQFATLPGDQVSLFLRVAGYQLTPRDFMLKSGTVTNITVVPNLTNLLIKLQPASTVSNAFYWHQMMLGK